MKREINWIVASLLLLAALPTGVTAQTAQLHDGDARYFDDPPAIIAYANASHVDPPNGVTITDSGGLWRHYEWIALMEQNDWIEATCTITDTTSVGVQFWGDANDGWARVRVDGAEVWTGNTYGSSAVGYIEYLEVSGLAPGSHTIRVENMGIAGGGGGDDVTVFFFGFESASSPPPPSTGSFTFYAIYDRIVDTDAQDVEVLEMALSGDGRKLIFRGKDKTTGDPVVYTVNADGSNLTQIALPAGLGGIWEVTIDYDGSRAFFRDTWDNALYRVADGIATKIFDVDDNPDIASCQQIQATADGEYVYFLNSGGYNGDVWSISHGGGGLTKVIEDKDVSTDTTYGIQEFVISANGSTIAFGLEESGVKKLFTMAGGSYHQLTSDGVDEVRISGDGTIIVFSTGLGEGEWHSIRSDGSARITLEETGWNVSGPDLTYDGGKMFYYDSGTNGRLVNTDGSGRLDIFPAWNVVTIPIAATAEASISDDGRRVAFTCDLSLYVGYLNDPDAVPGAPTIHNIAFDPPAMPRGDPNARITLTSQISDPQGLADVERTATDKLLDGRLEGDTADLPVQFPFAVHDDGSWPDQTAGDGVFSSEGQPGDKIDELDQMTVRVGAQDASKTVVVADTALFIGSAGQMPLLPPTNVQAQPGIESIELTWDPGTSAGLAGYNVYRSTVYTTTSDSGTWTKINTALVTGDRYLDSSSLITDTTYYYYLTTVDTASNESVPSNLASAIFGQVKLLIPDSYGATGMTVTLPVNIANADNLGISGCDVWVTYDAAILSAQAVSKTILTMGYDFAVNTSTPGVVRASIATAAGPTLYGEGSLFHMLFGVIGSSGEISRLAFNVTGTVMYDNDVNPVPLDLSDEGVFTVQDRYMLGDLNGDGKVTEADADLALEIAVGNVVPAPEQEAAGDVNGDGRINSADAVLIMRLASGLPLVPAGDQMGILATERVAAVSVSAPVTATAPQGGSVWVPLSIDDATDLAGADITLNYDPFVATAVGARTTSLSANFDVEYNVPVAGQAKISLKPQPEYEGGLAGGLGSLVEVQFTASPSATVGMTSTLNLATVRLSDGYGRDFATSALQVDVSTANGVLTVEEGGYFIYLPLVLRAYQ